jgi:hypothetical protein
MKSLIILSWVLSLNVLAQGQPANTQSSHLVASSNAQGKVEKRAGKWCCNVGHTCLPNFTTSLDSSGNPILGGVCAATWQ